MKKITRRLLACLLGAALWLASPCALAQQAAAAQIAVVLEDGSQQALPVQMTVTATGETVYWLDMSVVTEEQAAALEMGVLTVWSETGDVLLQLPLEGTEAGSESDGFVQLYDPEDPEIGCLLLLVPMAMPQDQQEIDIILDDYGYIGDELYAEYDLEDDGEEPYEEPDAYDETGDAYIDDEPGDLYVEGGYVEETPDVGQGWTEDDTFVQPQFVVPYSEGAALVSAEDRADVLALVGPGDLLTVVGVTQDDEDEIWWLVEDYRTGFTGMIRIDEVGEVGEDYAGQAYDRIDAEIIAE